MVRWGAVDIGKKANSELRGAKEGREVRFLTLMGLFFEDGR
jgi:hypothetical protein